jgi:hypothetical protein
LESKVVDLPRLFGKNPNLDPSPVDGEKLGGIGLVIDPRFGAELERGHFDAPEPERPHLNLPPRRRKRQ